MATSGRGTGIVGYNVQTAVDTKHHLIVAHEVTNVGHDRTQLADMAGAGEGSHRRQPITALADRGYFKGEEILRCATDGHRAAGAQAADLQQQGRRAFDKSDFVYDAERMTSYRCPAGERAIRRMTVVENGHDDCTSTGHRPAGNARSSPSARPAVERRIARWEHEAVLERMQARLDREPQAARERRQTVEHPFGTLKAWMGATHFLMRTLPKVRTEMSLHVLAYNMKRVIKLLGTASLIQAIQA